MSDDSVQPPRIGRSGFATSAREVVLIVLGVLIALSLEALWQYRLERLAERELLLALHEEFAANARLATAGGHMRVVAAAEAVVAVLEQAPGGQPVPVADSLLADLARTPRYRPDMNAMDAALSSGRVSLIRSSPIQSALASWRARLVEAQQEEQAGADLVYEQLLPTLSATTELGPALVWLSTDVERLGRDVPRQPAPATSSPVEGDRDVVNLIWTRYRLARAASNELALLQTRTEEVLTAIENELGSF